MKIQREQATADRSYFNRRLNMDGCQRKFFACIAAASGLLFCATTFAQDEETSVISSAGAVTQVPPAESIGVVNPALTFRDEAGNYQHIAPTIQQLPSAVSATDSGPLLYHGGPVMTALNVYSIFWTPQHLQSGATAPVMSAAYQSLVTRLAADYSGHSLSSVASQYYQTINNVTTYVSGLLGVIGGIGDDLGTYVDTTTFPVSKCVPAAVNCVSDAQVQAEVARVMTVKGWTGGMNKIFMIYLVQDEETCLSAGACSNTAFCGYHGHFTNSAKATVIYANMPYSNLKGCQVAGTPSPNANPAADQEMTTEAHEITEAVTDPLGNAWFSAQGNEIGDLCAFKYGTNTFDLPTGTTTHLANQEWNGHYYELQMMYDNHYKTCSQYGP
jgi:hypothetical protein